MYEFDVKKQLYTLDKNITFTYGNVFTTNT
jgi:hypothetical protein